MGLNLGHVWGSYSLSGIPLEHSGEERLDLFGKEAREFEPGTFYVIEHLVHVFVVKGWLPDDHLVKDAPQPVDVRRKAMSFFLEHLGR